MEMAPCKYLRLIAAAPTRTRRAPPKSNSNGREKAEKETEANETEATAAATPPIKNQNQPGREKRGSRGTH
jgi:hypothetical protein